MLLRLKRCIGKNTEKEKQKRCIGKNTEKEKQKRCIDLLKRTSGPLFLCQNFIGKK